MGPLFVISLLITFTLGQQYIYVNEWLTYSEAQAYCMTHYSATLAVFDTIDEASSLQTTIPSNESPARAFIGLDALGDYNTWEMADDDITQNWCSGDCDANSPVYWGITPSNPASNGACAVIRRLHFPLSQSIIQWPCDDRQRFICNKDPVTSKAPTAPTAPTIPQPSISPTQVPSKSPTSTTICCTCTNSRSGPGCSEDTACTNTVCNDDAFCCNSYWDSICGDLALNVCNSTPSPSISPSVGMYLFCKLLFSVYNITIYFAHVTYVQNRA